MAIGSGLGGSVGFGVETTPGTYLAPTRFPEATSAQMDRKPNFIMGGGLAAGRFLKPSSRYTLTHREGAGTVAFEVPSKGFGFLLQQLMGGTSTIAQQSATAAWLQTHLLGDTIGKTMSIQTGVPDTGGTVRPYTFLGCKTLGADFSCGVGEALTASFQYDAMDYSEAQSLAAPSFTTGIMNRNFSEMGFKLGTVGAEAAVTGVRKVTLHIGRPHNTGRQYANGAGKKAEPILNDFHEVTGTVETDFVTKADFADRVVGTGTISLVWEFIGPIIASTFAQTIRFTLPATVFGEGDPTLDGPDIVNPTFNFAVLDDQTNQPVKVEYMSTDTTI